MYSRPSASSVNIEFRPAQASATSNWYGPTVRITPRAAHRVAQLRTAAMLATARHGRSSAAAVSSRHQAPGSGTMNIRKNSGNQASRSAAPAR